LPPAMELTRDDDDDDMWFWPVPRAGLSQAAGLSQERACPKSGGLEQCTQVHKC